MSKKRLIASAAIAALPILLLPSCASKDEVIARLQSMSEKDVNDTLTPVPEPLDPFPDSTATAADATPADTIPVSWIYFRL